VLLSIFTTNSSAPVRRRRGPFKTLRPGYWIDFVAGLQSFQRALADELKVCHRLPVRLHEAVDDAQLRDRLSRCVAYGQHLQALTGQRREIGQFGFFGTSSALELLSTCKYASEFVQLSSEEWGLPVKTWGCLVLRLWNFIDLAVMDLFQRADSKFWQQSQTLLRNCHGLRATAAARGVISALSDQHKRHAIGCDIKIDGDLRQDFTEERAKQIGKTFFETIRSLRAPQTSPLDCFRGDQTVEVFTFHYANNSEDLPESAGDWLFLWGSVITALARGVDAGIITSEEFRSVCDIKHLSTIKTVLDHDGTCEDDRFRVFALWGISHLFPYGNASPKRHDWEAIQNWAEVNRGWFQRQVAAICRRLLASDLTLVDLHIPYQIYYRERFQDDYFVIPVLTVVIDLLARYQPHMVLSPRIHKLLRTWCDIASKPQPDGTLTLLPFQVGSFNGTVNALYYREAAGHCCESLEVLASKAWFIAPAQFVRSNARKMFWVTALVLLLAGIVATVVYSSKGNSFISGVLIGTLVSFLTSLITNLLTPRISKWLDGDSQ